MSLQASSRNPFDTCDYCGARFEPGIRYPVSTYTNDDRELELYSFCDSTCQAAWEAER